MGRKAIPATPKVAEEVNFEVIEKHTAAALEVMQLEDQLQTRIRAVALSVGYQLPADCTDPDLIQRDISANMRRSVEACLEVGRGLRVLKEACGHGNFVARLDVLGVDRFVAARFIHAAIKFSNVPSNAHLVKAIGNRTKLFEMLVLDDEQLNELELTGQTGELALDDVATMSVKELRAAVREANEAKAAKDRVIENDSKTIAALREQIARPFKPKKGNPAKDADEAAALSELFTRVMSTTVEVSRLAVVVRELQENPREPMQQRAVEAMQFIVMTVREIVREHNLQVNTSAEALGGMPEWLDLDAIAAAVAADGNGGNGGKT